MVKQIIKPTAGSLLVSEPALQDFYFKKSVILLAEHNEEGTFGLIINKPIQLRLHEVVKGFPEFDAKVFLGGPVKTDSLYFIHTASDLIPGSMKIMEGLFWGGDIDAVMQLITTKKLKCSDIRFYVGYSGWAPKQLDDELERKSWLVSKTTKEQVINTVPEQLWSSILRSKGGEYSLWANFPNDPSLN